jgi:hypothetical protein
MKKYYSFNILVDLLLKYRADANDNKDVRTKTATWLSIISLCMIFLLPGKVTAQCANYQAFESFSNVLPTFGGTWVATGAGVTLTYAAALPRTGNYHLSYAGVNAAIRTPMIANPGVFSFWYARSTNTAAHSFTIQTSPDNTTWTNRGTTGLPVASNVYEQFTIDLGALGLTNVYVKILDTRPSGGAARYIDDISWTSTVTSPTQNIMIPAAIAGCSQTVACGTTYSFTDIGSTSDTYSPSLDQTITFTPSVGTSKVQMIFSAFNTSNASAANSDGMVIYDGPSTASSVISSGLGAGLNATNCPAGSYYGTTSPGTITSSDVSGAITIRFRSDATTLAASTGWIASVSCFSIATCTAPTNQPTALVFGTVDTSSISGSFTASSPASDKYLIVRSTSATAPSPGPVNGTAYIAGNTISGATVVSASSSLSFTASGLTPSTTYYFYIYGYNDTLCTGGAAYQTINPLTNTTATVALATNDICSTAISVTSNASCSSTVGGTVGGTDNDETGDCTAGTEKAVWYKFTAISATETVNVAGVAGFGFNPVIGAITTCGTATVPTGGACINSSGDDGTETLFLTGLTVGATYYVQVYDFNGDNTANAFTICVTHPALCTTPTAQPANLVFDTVASSSIAGSFTAASPAPNKYLVVYSTSATPPSPGPNNTTVYTVGSTFSGATVVSASNSVTFTATGLTPNTHYYFYAYSYNDTACTGPIYNTASPLTNNTTTTNGVTNDICATAIAVTSNTSCSNTTGSTLGATDNDETGDCLAGTEKAVWYKFTAVNTTHTVTVVGAAGFDPVIGALSTCASATTPTGGACTDNTFGGGTETMTLTGLTIGNTYYVQVYDWWGVNMANAFTICITHVGPCTTPTAQPTGLTFSSITSNTISGSFTAASPAPNKYLVVRSTSATAPSPGPNNTSTYVVGNTFSGATVVSASNATTFTATGLSATTQYYFYVYSYNDSCTGGPNYYTTTPLANNATTLAPPTNITCAAATALPCGTLGLAGTTVGATNTAHGTACTMGNYGVWYTFTGDGNQTTVSSIATSGWDHEMSISSGSCGAYTNVACRDNSGTNGTESYTFTAVLGVNYYVYIAGFASASTVTGEFVISRNCTTPPAAMTNDECINAIPITINATCTFSTYTNGTATASAGIPAPGCAGYSGGDVWFSIVVPANGIVRADTQSIGMTDGGMAFYSGACGGLTFIECDDFDSSDPNDMPYISRTGMTPGATIYIRMWSYNNADNGAFGLCVTSPASCTTGTGLGTSALGCPSVTSGGLSLNGVDPAPVNACLSSTCVDLEATYLQLGQTTNYTVSSIPYTPPYQYGCLANPVSVNVDDIWSPLVNLPFNFCYYGVNYNSCLIGSNGVLTFDTTTYTPATFSAWSFTNNIPSTNLFKNTIFGVYHDIDPSKGGEVGWELITLTSGCRALVASWNNVPMFDYNNIYYTGMMVLYENTNIIEVYVKEKRIDDVDTSLTWNDGNAIIGLQNATGTAGIAAPGRNGLDANWTVLNEAWRFTPAGPSITSIKWYEGSGTTGPVVGTTPTINVCPTSTTTYTAEVSYDLCNGARLKQSDETTVTVLGSKSWNGTISSAWDNDNNWTPVGKPTALDCVIIPVTPNNPVISGTGYNGLGFTLSVLDNATLTVNSNNSITITDFVNVESLGNFIIENDASLVQENDVVNNGDIKYKREASIRKLDYVYWSSPVFNFNVNNISIPVVPGPIYKWHPTVNNPNGGQGQWQSAAGETMLRAKGYIVRGPDTFTTTPATLYGVFTGIPNNGTITTPISRGDDQQTAFHAGINGTEITNLSDNNNLVGNPYPSAIRGSQFLFDNRTKIEGNIKVWTHGSLPAQIASPFYNTFIYNYSAGDYLTYTFTGTSCCPAAGSDLFVGAGQGFFVQMIDGPAASGFVTFNNGQRSATYDNSAFYRMANSNTPNNIVDLERHRIWLDIIDANNSSDRTLVGYIEGATANRDSFFDANALVGGAMTIYSLIDNGKYVIQGRSLPFDQNDMVPLGVVIPAAGSYKIAIAALDGLFEGAAQHVYLEDLELGIIHDLRVQPYSFSAVNGIYNDRFRLRFTNGLLGVNAVDAEDLSAFINDQKFFANATQNIHSIEIFDVSGKLVKAFAPKEKSRQFSDDFVFANGVYFAKIKLENGMSFTKKLINNP